MGGRRDRNTEHFIKNRTLTMGPKVQAFCRAGGIVRLKGVAVEVEHMERSHLERGSSLSRPGPNNEYVNTVRT